MFINHQSFFSEVTEFDDDSEDTQIPMEEQQSSHHSSLQQYYFGKLHFHSSTF